MFERRFLVLCALAVALCAGTVPAFAEVVFRDLFFDISNASFTISGTDGALFYDGFESGSTSAWSP